jgi:hypothetical protein
MKFYFLKAYGFRIETSINTHERLWQDILLQETS